ncbi:glycogen debranching enzyme N-terminal domain-containing protein [Actinoplanes sp. NPDC051411]|uniref:glycogen debranching enzyme N-terminal domain-containing protein n=1 Tax=Actinoplanes sp. NPDC051411 TaxID=3155522 RepID=UPI003447C749
MATVRRLAFGPQVCGRLDEGSAREWLVPDGCGGYAMGTAGGLRTRRYHGLLVVAGENGRHLGPASLDPILTLPSGVSVRLGTHEWADGTIAPRGHELLAGFELVDGLPRWRWRVGDVVVERELAMAHGRPAVAIVHRLLTGGPVSLALDTLCTWRDVHGERGASGPPPTVSEASGGCVVADAYRLRGPGFRRAGSWWRGVHYRAEAARGLNPQEDLWHAGRFHAELRQPGATAEVTAWASDLDSAPPPASEIIQAARSRNRAIVAAARPADDAQATLALAADATLWFLHAVGRHVAVTDDTDLAASLLPALRDVVDHHLAGTRYGIGADPADGLLRQGAPGEALTWMDARVDGVPVTARAGKPVEINALWVNGLAMVIKLAWQVRVGAAVREQRDLDHRAPPPAPTRPPWPRSPAASRPWPAASPTWSTARPATTRPCGPISCWRGRCRTPRCAPHPASCRPSAPP